MPEPFDRNNPEAVAAALLAAADLDELMDALARVPRPLRREVGVHLQQLMAQARTDVPLRDEKRRLLRIAS